MYLHLYLALEADGHCVVHVAELPGCAVRRADREAALAALPAAVQQYQGWLRQFEPTVTIPAQVEWEVVAETAVSGVDTLLAVDKRPLTPSDRERYLQLAAYQRQELVALARPLVKAMRQWRPHPDSMSINEVVHHVGRAEQWYLSRLFVPDRLPDSWWTPAEPALFAFVAQVRETAVHMLSNIPSAALDRVTQTGFRTSLPEEPWTARKVLRRLLEHEREHIDHIREILGQWRQQLLARLTGERYHLLAALWGVDAATLSSSVVADGLTAKDWLAHIAFWDGWHTDRLVKAANGRLDELVPLGDETAVAAVNQQVYEQFKEQPLEAVWALLHKERSGFLAALKRIPDAVLHRRIATNWGWRGSLRTWLSWRFRHDADHARALRRWRQSLPQAAIRPNHTPKFVLRGLLKTSHKQFATLAQAVPSVERELLLVCGIWHTKDLVGHLVDWELVGLDGLRQLAHGQTPEFEYEITDFEAFNLGKAEARREQPWAAVWAEFINTHRRLVALLDATGEEMLKRPFVTPWGSEMSGTTFVHIWAHHAHEHAVDLRAALHLARLPTYLRQL